MRFRGIPTEVVVVFDVVNSLTSENVQMSLIIADCSYQLTEIKPQATGHRTKFGARQAFATVVKRRTVKIDDDRTPRLGPNYVSRLNVEVFHPRPMNLDETRQKSASDQK